MPKARCIPILSLLTITLLSACGGTRGPYVTATPQSTSVPTRRTPTMRHSPVPTDATGNAEFYLEMPPMPPGFGSPPDSFTLSSGAFAAGGEIPIEYTCHGDNVSPALSWSGVPADAQSLVLVMTDPDATPAEFVHWLVYNIPADSAVLEPFQPNEATLSDGALQGLNAYSAARHPTAPSGEPISTIGYAGPCPPSAHRYVLRLYALDTILPLEPGATSAQVAAAMRSHVLALAELEGRFSPPS